MMQALPCTAAHAATLMSLQNVTLCKKHQHATASFVTQHSRSSTQIEMHDAVLQSNTPLLSMAD